jgi:hypothetical protein
MATNLIFIGGGSGSGTTLLSRLLSSPDCCASLGGNYLKLPSHPHAKPLVDAFLKANIRVWDKRLSFGQHEEGRRDWQVAMQSIVTSPAFAETSHYIFKRSFPFEGGKYTPDVWDLIDCWPDVKVLLIYRDPRAATYSKFRRGFDADIRKVAINTQDHLTWLDGQVRAIGPERFRFISYARLCVEPTNVLKPIADFCSIPFDQVNEVARREGMHADPDARWMRELSPQDSDWLNKFFDDRRLKQWEILESRCR